MNNERNQIIGLLLLGGIFILVVCSMIAGFKSAMKLHEKNMMEYKLNDSIKDSDLDSINVSDLDSIKE